MPRRVGDRDVKRARIPLLYVIEQLTDNKWIQRLAIVAGDTDRVLAGPIGDTRWWTAS